MNRFLWNVTIATLFLLGEVVCVAQCTEAAVNNNHAVYDEQTALDTFSAETLSEQFQNTLQAFLNEVYIGHAFAKEVSAQSPALRAYLSEEIALKRLAAPGAFAYLFDAQETTDFGRFGYSAWELDNDIARDWPNMRIIPAVVKLGECDEVLSSEEDGVYYSPVSTDDFSMPYVDPTDMENIRVKNYQLPAAFTDHRVMQVEIVRDKKLKQKLFFIYTQVGWRLFLIDDVMACSA